eukprot:5455078-Ditylum_brightwellii.AAC.1
MCIRDSSCSIQHLMHHATFRSDYAVQDWHKQPLSRTADACAAAAPHFVARVSATGETAQPL